MSALKQHLDNLAPMPQSEAEKNSSIVRDFREIILTDEETEEALRSAREKKFFVQKRIEYLASLNQPKKYPKYTAEELFKIIGDQLDVDDQNEIIFRNLAYYFTNDSRGDFNLDKGICLFGGVGVGKTTIMKFLRQNQKQSYVMKMCRAVEDEFAKDGDGVLKQYGVSIQPARNADPFGHQVLGFCFDDLGTEPLSRYYGKDTNVMAEIILNRYDNNLSFNLTHITTNLSIGEIEKRYGPRVTDRMGEMFNIISFDKEAKSRRK